ncbi:MAG: sensor histidine kinase [Desulfotomaculales bacterium]
MAEAYAAQRRFVADVSHELRTPLTIIRGNLELLQQIDQGNGPRREVLADATGEAERMSRLLNNLLILARADAGQHIEKTPLDLGALIQDVARQAPLLGPNPFHTRDLDTLSGSQVMGHADYLKQLFLILLDNAFKYTPAAGEITLAANRREGWYAVGVTHSGPGIPPKKYRASSNVSSAGKQDARAAPASVWPLPAGLPRSTAAVLRCKAGRAWVQPSPYGSPPCRKRAILSYFL